MKKIYSIVFLFLATPLFSQAISEVKTILQENKYGNTRLMVKPLAYDMKAEKPTSNFGVYALLVCYNYKGKQKALHQDLTYDFANKGEKEIFLEMGAKRSNISIISTLFYRRDLTPENERPKKSDCFK